MSKKKKLKGHKKGRHKPKTVQDKTKAAQNKTMLIYYVSVIGFAFAYHIISNQDWFLAMAKPIFEGYASIGSSILSVLGEESTADGISITSPHFNMTIKEGCDAITPIILYSMAILAFPTSFRLKWPGLVLGITVLFLLNIIRIISLYFVGKHFSHETFDFMHVDVWQILFLILTIFTWLLWMRWALISKAEKSKSI